MNSISHWLSPHNFQCTFHYQHDEKEKINVEVYNLNWVWSPIKEALWIMVNGVLRNEAITVCECINELAGILGNLRNNNPGIASLIWSPVQLNDHFLFCLLINVFFLYIYLVLVLCHSFFKTISFFIII